MDPKSYWERRDDIQEIVNKFLDSIGIYNIEPREERYCERCDSQLPALRYHLKICANCSKESIAEFDRENKSRKVPKLKFPFTKNEYIPIGE